MQPRDDRAREGAYLAWRQLGGDAGLFAALWPAMGAQLRERWPSERFTRSGVCADCSIRAGAGFETPGLNRAGRCPACECFYRRHGPALKASREDADL